MVEDPMDWLYSSYRFYAYGAYDPLVTMSVTYESLSDSEEDRKWLYRSYVESTRPYETIIDKELTGTR
jgi:hypothetical protein